jgi:hypothetical protein
MTQYLIRKRGKSRRAHIWNGTDTACRMASTGGLKVEDFAVVESVGDMPICRMCSEKGEEHAEEN